MRGRCVSGRVPALVQGTPFHAIQPQAEQMQDGRSDIRQVAWCVDDGAASQRTTLHDQHRREFRPMQAAMHAATLRHIRRIEGGVAGQAPFIGGLAAGEGHDKIGAAHMTAAQQRERQRPIRRQDRRIARQQRPAPGLRRQPRRHLRREPDIPEPETRRGRRRDDDIHAAPGFGQSQRVAIARALMQRPDLILADEPVASLDPVAGREVMALLADLARQRNITVLFTTHHMEHALHFADRIVGLRGGAVALDASAGAARTEELERFFD